MNAPQHYARAQDLIAGLDQLDLSDPDQRDIARVNLQTAAVHAQLADVALHALVTDMPPGHETLWREGGAW